MQQQIVFLVLGLVGLVVIMMIISQIRQRKNQENIGSLAILNDDLDDGVIAVRKKDTYAQEDFYLQEDMSAQNQSFKESNDDHGITILHVIAKTGKTFAGYELLQILLSSGLRFGEMNIFHYYQDAEAQQDVLFSLASATEPGIFDLLNMGTFSCKGLTLFMRKKGNAQEDKNRYALMLEIAKHLSEDLDGLLIDAHKQLIQVTQEASA